jgi:hypothetical protein
MDWQEFVETMSVVEQTLRQDPAGIYGKMEFATRDQYRHAIEKSPSARAAKWKWRSKPCSWRAPPRQRRRAPWPRRLLPDRRRPAALEKQAGMRRPWLEALQQTSRASPLTSYLGAIAAIAGGTALLLERAAFHGVQGWCCWRWACWRCWAAASWRWPGELVGHAGDAPHPLPRMDYQDGIPADARGWWWCRRWSTARRISTACSSSWKCASSPTAIPTCVLPADRFRRCRAEKLPGDDALIEHLKRCTAHLNHKYADAKPVPAAAPSAPVESAGRRVDGL